MPLEDERVKEQPSRVVDTSNVFLASTESEDVVPFVILSQWNNRSLHKYLSDRKCQLDDARKIWRRLLRTTNCPTISDQHQTAACNALCVFVRSCYSSDAIDVQHFGHQEATWRECFENLRTTWAFGKTKPKLQVLEMLVKWIKDHPNREVADFLLQNIAEKMISVVFSQKPDPLVKFAVLVLLAFLKTSFGLIDLLYLVKKCHQKVESKAVIQFESYSLSPDSFPHSMEPSLLSFIRALIYAVLEPYTRNSAVKLLTLLMKGDIYRTAEDKLTLQDPIMSLLQSTLRDRPESIDICATEIFPIILEHNKEAISQFIRRQTSVSTHSTTLPTLLAVLLVFREKKWLEESDLPELVQRSINITTLESEYAGFTLLLGHHDGEIRYRSFRLLTASALITAPIPLGALRCIKESIGYLFGQGDAHERSKILSTTRRFILRLRGAASFLDKSSYLESARKISQEYEVFAKWFCDYLVSELGLSASYQRHAMALTALHYVLDSGIDEHLICVTKLPSDVSKLDQPSIAAHFSVTNQPRWPFSICLRTSQLAHSALELLLDPFEDIRALAAHLLSILTTQPDGVEGHVKFAEEFLNQLENKMYLSEILAKKTNRSDHADGLGRMLYLLARRSSPSNGNIVEKLLSRLDMALSEVDQINHPLDLPLHGLLNGIMYCVESQGPKEVKGDSLVKLCNEIWMKVQIRLCIDSPENTVEDEDGESSTGPKDMLSYAWRALRDSSLVLYAMIEHIARSSNISDFQTLQHIGDLCIQQLTTLRHRGAFSTVAQTFKRCCDQVLRFEGVQNPILRRSWYEIAVHQMEEQARRLTRRSAGLPAMFAAILSPNDTGLFTEFVTICHQMAQAPISVEPEDTISEADPALPQVHALNCLKEILTNSRFGSATDPHIVTMLDLAASSLQSNTWAIRNCGLMLFRACINRLEANGTDMRVNAASTKSPQDIALHILDIATMLLQSDRYRCSSLDGSSPNMSGEEAGPRLASPETSFAAIELISVLEFSDADHGIFVLLLDDLKSNVWAIREQAASIYVKSLPPQFGFGRFRELCASITLDLTQNEIHGKLLCCRLIMNKCVQPMVRALSKTDMQKEILALRMVIQRLRVRKTSPINLALVLEIYNDTLAFQIQEFGLDELYFDEKDLTMINSLVNSKQNRTFSSLDQVLAFNLAIVLENSVVTQMEQRQHLLAYFRLLVRSDADVARYVLEKIGQYELELHFSLPMLLTILNPVLALERHEDVKALALSLISQHMEQDNFEVEPFEIKILQDILISTGIAGRTLWNAKIRFQANIFARTLGFFLSNVPDWKTSAYYTWVEHLRIAVEDEIDFPTRMSAAISLSTFLLSKNILTIASKNDEQVLELYLILYDFLNDDDEELRDFTANTATNFLVHKRCGNHFTVPLSPPAASGAFLLYLLDAFSESINLAVSSVGRVIGEEFDIRKIEQQNLKSVAERFEIIASNSNALFAEEKQNLYVDDILEVETWTQVLEKLLARTSIPPKLYGIVSSWTVQGLQVIKEFLKSLTRMNDEVTGGFFTSNVEVLTLFTRVIRLSGVIICHERSHGTAATGTEHDGEVFTLKARILNSLKTIHGLAESPNSHPRLNTTVTEVLHKNE